MSKMTACTLQGGGRAVSAREGGGCGSPPAAPLHLLSPPFLPPLHLHSCSAATLAAGEARGPLLRLLQRVQAELKLVAHRLVVG